jgi:hypothetical protein
MPKYREAMGLRSNERKDSSAKDKKRNNTAYKSVILSKFRISPELVDYVLSNQFIMGHITAYFVSAYGRVCGIRSPVIIKITVFSLHFELFYPITL